MTSSFMSTIDLESGISLEVELFKPPLRNPDAQGSSNKLAILLHPWSWLGGRMNDPVLNSLIPTLKSKDYHLLRFNSRGVGKSSGWPSLSGFSEGKDLEELVQWGLQQVPDVQTVIIVGYSHGSLIATLHGVLPPPIKVSHLLLSYPLGYRGLLTLFNGGTYASKLKELIQDPRSNVLVVFGDHDEFTSISKYRGWQNELESLAEAADRGTLKVVEIEGGSHFWGGRAGEDLIEAIGEWAVLSSSPFARAQACSLLAPSFFLQNSFNNTPSNMPLPDERPRASVANLIGRFEQQTKRQSLSSSTAGPNRSSSVASHNTGDSAKEELKEKREWPPRDDKPPPPIVPSSSWSRSLAAGSEVKVESKTSSPPPSRPATDQPSSTIPSAAEAAPPPATKPPAKAPSAPAPSTPSKASSAPSARSHASSAKTAPSKPAESTTKSPHSSIKSPPKSTSSLPHATPLKAQHTGQSTTSTSTSRKPTTKPHVPVTPRAKTPSRPSMGTPRLSTPSRPKTPSSARPKTPSTGLFAPTAASLAKARNAPEPKPAPVKKSTLSASVADRLSKPTAASLSKARTPAAAAAPPVRGGKAPARGTAATRGTSRPGATKPKVTKPTVPKAGAAVAGGAAVAAAVAAVGAVAADADADADLSEDQAPEPAAEAEEIHNIEEETHGEDGDVADETSELKDVPSADAEDIPEDVTPEPMEVVDEPLPVEDDAITPEAKVNDDAVHAQEGSGSSGVQGSDEHAPELASTVPKSLDLAAEDDQIDVPEDHDAPLSSASDTLVGDHVADAEAAADAAADEGDSKAGDVPTKHEEVSPVAEHTSPKIDVDEAGRIDEVKARSPTADGDDLAAMVNMLEFDVAPKFRPASISSIPDEIVQEIPDEE
ncbi:hypothetical protein HGRIS_003774 [Hohenbuehelia grisea]|uniref:AB hydrolase-1 domain-containing protein n=1 Tax=Hohenbuehelia grisea TaxID=104357 RepID=A0ABR3JGG2_9AGAR